jgi:hypothetical protein
MIPKMASITLLAIRVFDYLGFRTIFTHAMFCSVVAGQKNWIVFPAQISQDVCWEVVGGASVPPAHLQQGCPFFCALFCPKRFLSTRNVPNELMQYDEM